MKWIKSVAEAKEWAKVNNRALPTARALRSQSLAGNGQTFSASIANAKKKTNQRQHKNTLPLFDEQGYINGPEKRPALAHRNGKG